MNEVFVITELDNGNLTSVTVAATFPVAKEIVKNRIEELGFSHDHMQGSDADWAYFDCSDEVSIYIDKQIVRTTCETDQEAK